MSSLRQVLFSVQRTTPANRITAQKEASIYSRTRGKLTKLASWCFNPDHERLVHVRFRWKNSSDMKLLTTRSVNYLVYLGHHIRGRDIVVEFGRLPFKFPYVRLGCWYQKTWEWVSLPAEYVWLTVDGGGKLGRWFTNQWWMASFSQTDKNK